MADSGKSHDPRLQQQKRPAIAQPEGQPSPQRARPDPGQRSSSSTPRHSGPNSYSAHRRRPSVGDASRRSSTQVQTNLLREHGGSYVASPASVDSRGSRYEDAPSGNTTPLSVTARQSVPPVPQMTTANPFLNPMNTASDASIEVSRLSLSVSQWEARVKRADLEFNGTADRHAAFPSLRDQKAGAQTYAREQLRKHKEELEIQKEKQRRAMEALANMFQSAVGAKPVTMTTTDPAGAALAEEMKKLKEQVKELKSSVAIAASVKELDAVERTTKSAVQQLTTRVATLEGAPKTAPSAPAQDEQLRDRLRAVELGVGEAKKLANQANSFAGQGNRAALEINALQKADDEYKRDANTLRMDMRRNSDRITTQETELAAFKKKVASDSEKVGKSLEIIKGHQTTFSNFVMGEEKEDMSSPIDGNSSLGKKVEHALDAMKDLKKSMNTLEAEIQEKGKDPVVKRLKNHDVLLNNLNNQVQNVGGPGLKQQLSQLEQDLNAVQADVKAIKSAPSTTAMPSSTAGMPADVQVFEARLQAVEKLPAEIDAKVAIALKEAEDWREKCDETILEHVDEKLATMNTEVDNSIRIAVVAAKDDVAAWRAEDAVAFNNSLAEVKDVTDGLQKQMKDLETSVKSAEQGVKALTELQEAVRVLERSDVQNVEALGNVQRRLSELNTSLTEKADSAMVVKGLTLAEQRLTELRTGVTSGTIAGPVRRQPSALPQDTFPPQTNGFQPLTNGSPKVNGNSPLLPQTEQVMSRLDALTSVTNHLRHRFDNLTTDDMAKKILDQLAITWPHAKNYEGAIQALKHQFSGIDGRLAKIQSDVAQAAKIEDLTKDVSKKYEAAAGEIAKLRINVRTVEKLIADDRKTMEAIKNEVLEKL
ncbi:hypothetical protein LTR17_011560 [Elasticomyces elasticus]|nr:hypothetical protein LTR17_011560 [Elasticomyces elasticus]